MYNKTKKKLNVSPKLFLAFHGVKYAYFYLGIKVIEHNNFTGQWLTPLKAVWHPQREDVFVVGSLLKPRRVNCLKFYKVAFSTFFFKILD